MDEDDDFLKTTSDLLDESSFSSDPLNIQNNKERRENQQGKQTISTTIAYGVETIPITEKFAMNCKRALNICIDENGPSVIINVPGDYKIVCTYSKVTL